MLDSLKRWLGRSQGPDARRFDALRDWAERRGLEARQVRDGGGLVVDGRIGEVAWRVEWGPAQRAYVSGLELRIRAEIDVPADLQLMVVNRRLKNEMEATIFDQYVEGVQTRIDDRTPPEMRWLVMFPKLPAADLGALRDRYGAVGNQSMWLKQWIGGALGTALQSPALPRDVPLVLTIGRSRLTLRAECNDPEPALFDACFRAFEAALREAAKVAAIGLRDEPTEPGGSELDGAPTDTR